MIEIKSIVNNLIEEVENRNPILIKSIDCHGKELTINITELKNSKKCQSANVFNYLINLQDEESRWERRECCKHCNQNLWDNKGRYTLLKIYGISTREWMQFTYYLRHIHPPYFGAWANGGDNETQYYSKIVNWLEDVNEICNKFGGFPDFDEYYEKFWEGNISNEAFGTCVPHNITPPRHPREDIHENYLWKTFVEGSVSHAGWLHNILHQHKNWSVVSVQDIPNQAARIWYRCAKY